MKLTFLILDYNRPNESELCLKSIKTHTKFPHQITYLSNAGEQDYVIDFYKKGLIDKLILRRRNSGCGLGSRELFNDFDLESKYVIYCQCDQFMVRDFTIEEYNYYCYFLSKNSKTSHVDLSGNQGNGKYSERAHLINKDFYNSIPNTIGGPGPFANEKWTEQSVQEFLKEKGYSFSIAPCLFADNGKISRREYPCGGILMMHTDTKAVFIEKPIKTRIDFPNVHLTDSEWSDILANKWKDGSIPELHRKNSFKYWEKPYNIRDFK